jgi:hypothetical protein
VGGRKRRRRKEEEGTGWAVACGEEMRRRG